MANRSCVLLETMVRRTLSIARKSNRLSLIARGRQGEGPQSFEVTLKDGTRLRYGGVANSRVRAFGKETIRVWALDRITDLNENFMTIEYFNFDTENGAFYPRRILYTDNSRTHEPGHSSVEFEYEDRPDVITDYIGGSVISYRKRLKYISTHFDGQFVKQYLLRYDTGSSTGRSILTRVNEVAGLWTLPATSFTWQVKPNAFQPAYWWGDRNKTIAQKGSAEWFVDVNGDGMTDHVFESGDKNGGRYFVQLSSGSSFQSNQDWGGYGKIEHDGDAQWFVDINGDGMTDTIYNEKGNDDYLVLLSTGTKFSGPAKWGTKAQGVEHKGKAQWFADVNGDGRADHIYNSTKGKNKYRVQLSEGAIAGNDNEWGEKTYGVADDGRAQWIIDINGDGMADHVYVREKTNEYWVGLSTGKSFAQDRLWGTRSYSVAQSGYYQWYVDVNGDGLVDLVYAHDGSNANRAIEYRDWIRIRGLLGSSQSEH